MISGVHSNYSIEPVHSNWMLYLCSKEACLKTIRWMIIVRMVSKELKLVEVKIILFNVDINIEVHSS